MSLAPCLQAWERVKPAVDPFQLVKAELDSVAERMRRTVNTDIPTLGRAAEYFFQLGAEGKRLRPTMLLLMASSLSAFVPTAALLAGVALPCCSIEVKKGDRSFHV